MSDTSPRARDTVSRPALLLVGGRGVGFVAAFAIPIVLARVFDPAEFGTYKQLFLVFTTLYGIAQLGMAESLYYFVPTRSQTAGRHVCNAVLTLALAGLACLALLSVTDTRVGAWLANSDVSSHLTLIGALLALTLATSAFEIVMISRSEHLKAALTYATSDLARTLLLIIPAMKFGGVREVLIGAVAFGALRLAAMMAYLWRAFGRSLRVDLRVWRDQFAYALPFALAVGVEVAQINLHQYVVAARFDAATFAIYAVGCLQIPLVDLVMTSTSNVMMVQMAAAIHDGDRDAVVGLWHDAVCKLAFVIVPLAAFLLIAARAVIVTLFTTTYMASVPIFMVWTLGILSTVFLVDSVLRTYAQTRFLLLMNVIRFGLVVGLIGWFLSEFGLIGAVLVTLLSTGAVRALAVFRIAQLLHLSVRNVLPWRRLTGIVVRSAVAAAPAFWVVHTLTFAPLAVLACAAAAYGAAYVGLSIGWLMSELPTLPGSLRTQQISN
jgi:O-antigen/teichoic acid export membrane protein